MLQIKPNPPALVVEPEPCGANDELMSVVASPNRRGWRRLQIFVPKSNSRIASLASEMLHAHFLALFQRGLEGGPHLIGCHTRSEVDFAVFRDLRQDLAFQVRKEN